MRRYGKEKWNIIEAFRRYAVILPDGRRGSSDTETAAIDMTMEALTEDEKNAVLEVYMYAPKESITAEKVRYRVMRTAYSMYYSDSQVYRMLKHAREVYTEQLKIAETE